MYLYTRWFIKHAYPPFFFNNKFIKILIYGIFEVGLDKNHTYYYVQLFRFLIQFKKCPEGCGLHTFKNNNHLCFL